MLRDPNLVPLSRQHQHALALCVRIHRAPLATAAELKAWQAEIEQHVEQEIQYHFAAEEAHVFPLARRYPELYALVEELLEEHAKLRSSFAEAKARTLDAPRLRKFADMLSTHIRKEERQLFEGMQQRVSEEEMRSLGELIDRSLAAAPQVCITPTEQTLKSGGA
jgi:hemerythrin-like domain-containing protein